MYRTSERVGPEFFWTSPKWLRVVVMGAVGLLTFVSATIAGLMSDAVGVALVVGLPFAVATAFLADRVLSHRRRVAFVDLGMDALIVCTTAQICVQGDEIVDVSESLLVPLRHWVLYRVVHLSIGRVFGPVQDVRIEFGGNACDAQKLIAWAQARSRENKARVGTPLE